MSDIESFVHEHVPGGRPLDLKELRRGWLA